MLCACLILIFNAHVYFDSDWPLYLLKYLEDTFFAQPTYEAIEHKVHKLVHAFSNEIPDSFTSVINRFRFNHDIKGSYFNMWKIL